MSKVVSLFALAEQFRASLLVKNVRSRGKDEGSGYIVHASVTDDAGRSAELYLESDAAGAEEAQLECLHRLLLMFKGLQQVASAPSKPEKKLKVVEEEVEGTEVTDQSEEVEEEEPPKKEAKNKPNAKDKGGKGGKKEKTIKYDRELDTHKELLGDLFTTIVPGWDSEDLEDSPLQEKCLALSKALVGKPFLNEKGEVLDSVEEIIREQLEEYTEKPKKKKRGL